MIFHPSNAYFLFLHLYMHGARFPLAKKPVMMFQAFHCTSWPTFAGSITNSLTVHTSTAATRISRCETRSRATFTRRAYPTASFITHCTTRSIHTSTGGSFTTRIRVELTRGLIGHSDDLSSLRVVPAEITREPYGLLNLIYDVVSRLSITTYFSICSDALYILPKRCG